MQIATGACRTAQIGANVRAAPIPPAGRTRGTGGTVRGLAADSGGLRECRIWRGVAHARVASLRAVTFRFAGMLVIPAQASCLCASSKVSTARNGTAFQASSMRPPVKLFPPLKSEERIE